MIEIKNAQSKQYYDYLNSCFHNQQLPEINRINAYRKMNIISKLVLLYEYNETWDEDDWDDLLLDYGRPVFPEEYPTIIDRLNNYATEEL